MSDLPLPAIIVLVTGLLAVFGGLVVRGRRGWSAFTVVGFAAAMASLALDDTGSGHRQLLDWLLLGTGFAFAASLAGLPSHQRDLFASHPRGGLVPGLLGLSIGGAMLIGVATDHVARIVGLELALAPLAVLLLRTSGDDESRGAALRYATAEIPGFLAIVTGAAILYSNGLRVDSPAAVAAAVLVMSGLAIRARIAPFHAGAEEVHAGTSAWTAGVLAVVPRLAVAGFLVAELPRLASVAGEATRNMGLVVGVVAVVAGGIAAMFRDNLRRTLAAVTMCHFGAVFSCAAVAVWDTGHPDRGLSELDSFPAGMGALLLHHVAYTIVTTGAYAVLVHVTRPERRVDHVDDLTGLARTEPAAAVSLSVLLLAAAGLPPFVGFWSRLSAVVALGASGTALGEGYGPMVTDASPIGRGLVITAGLAVALGGVMILAAFARWLVTMLFDQPRTGVRPSGGEPALAVAVLLAILALGLGVIPAPLLAWIRTMSP